MSPIMNYLRHCLLGCCGFFAAGFITLAQPLNSGFESSLADWSVTIPEDYSEFDSVPRPAGTATVVDSWQRGWMPAPKFSEEGLSFLALGSHDYAFYTNSVLYDITVQQVVSLQQGMTLTGTASFYNGDYAPQDSAWVKIFDDTGFELLATPWQQFSGGFPAQPGDPNFTEYRLASDWSAWQWTAPSSGNYTLSFGVTTQGDNRYGSFGFFDAVGVITAIPEPSTATLTLLLLGALGLRRSLKKA
jgi:hypothetical protein